MKRREFLVGAAAAAGLVSSRKGWAQARDEAKLRRVAIMSLCFNSILKNPSQPETPARTLDVMDLGQMLADRYGVHNVEMQHAHFPSTEPAYFKDFRDRLATLYEEWRAHMAAGVATLDPPPTSDPRLLASLVQAIIHGLVMQLQADPVAFDRGRMLELCLSILAQAVGRSTAGRRRKGGRPTANHSSEGRPHA